METFTAQQAQEHLISLVETILQENNKYRISLPEGNVILLSEKSYEDLMITLELLSTPLLLQDDDHACCHIPASS